MKQLWLQVAKQPSNRVDILNYIAKYEIKYTHEGMTQEAFEKKIAFVC